MLDFLKGYWSKHPQKQRTLIALIDNHKSKCVHAEQTLNERLKNGLFDPQNALICERKLKVIRESKKLLKKSKKAKKKSKKKKDSKKRKKSKDAKSDEQRMLTNSSADEEAATQPKGDEEAPKTVQYEGKVEHRIFNYTYNEENVNYKRCFREMVDISHQLFGDFD